MQTNLYLPSNSALAEYATLVWQVNNPAAHREYILPQGVVEIIFCFSGPVSGDLPGGSAPVVAPRCFIQGFNTAPVLATYQEGQHLLGVQLRADCVRHLLGVLPGELLNTLVDLSLIDKRIENLWLQLAEAPHFKARIEVLAGRLPALAKKPCPRATQLSRLVQEEGIDAFGNVDALARAVCYSSRQLGRISKQLFGLPPEGLISYKKFMEAVRLMHRPHLSLTSVAYDAGFCDQAHFNRSFKTFSGITPGEYRARKTSVPFHLYS